MIKHILIFINILFPALPTFAQAYKQLYDSSSHYTAKNDYNTAIMWGEKALHQAEIEFGKNDTLYANTLTTLVEICYYSGKFEKGATYTLEEIAIRKKVQGENHPDYAESINNLAAIYKTMGRYTESEELFLKLKEIWHTTLNENHSGFATYLNNLSELYKTMGRYIEAEELLLKSNEIWKITIGENHPDYAASLNNLASLYESMGRYPEAERLYLKSKEIWKITIGENHPDYATSLSNLASLYNIMGRYPEAEELNLRSKEIKQTILGENNPSYAVSLNNMAQLYETLGRYLEAEKLYLKSKEKWQITLGENHPDFAQSLDNLAGLYQAIGRYSEAEELYLRSQKIRQIILGENHPDFALGLKNLSELYEKTANTKDANIYFQQALQKNIHQINAYFPGMSEKEKGQFFNTIKGNFEHYYSFVASLHTLSLLEIGGLDEIENIRCEIFNYRLATKGLLFNSSNKMRQNILNCGDTTLIELFSMWKSKRDYLAMLFTLSKAEIEMQGVSIETLQKEINDIEKELSKKSVLFDKGTEKRETTWQNVQSQLNEGEAFVEMIRFRKYGTLNDTIHYNDSSWNVIKDGFTNTVYYAALILKPPNQKSKTQNLTLVILNNGNELEKMYYEGYKLAIKHFQLYGEGYTQYWTRIAKELQEIRTVYFSADGVYNQINLNTLQNPKTGKYLLEEKDIRLVTSSKDIMKITNHKSQITKSESLTASLYGFVNYDNNIASKDFGNLPVLQGTQKEIENIESLLKENNWQIQMHQWNSADEGTLKNEQNPTVLHIATHGYFLAEENIKGVKTMGIDSIFFILNPLLRSGLLLAVDTAVKEKKIKYSESGLGLYDKEEDGILTAYEAMNLNLDNTELVVLSACETGKGDVVVGEGVFGLQRAFQQAGAKTVIMSLWKVSDQHTQELMTLFYSKWLSGINKTQAFIQTQQEMKIKYIHPYYWGAFVLVGH